MKAEPRVGDLLLERGLLTADELELALAEQARSGERLGRILLARGMVSRRRLQEVLGEQWGTPFADLEVMELDDALVSACDPEQLTRDRWIPLHRSGDEVVIATVERPDGRIRNEVRKALGDVGVRFATTTEWDLRRAITRAFRPRLTHQAVFALVERSPQESAYSVLLGRQFGAAVAMVVGAALALWRWPLGSLVAVNFALNIAFALSLVFKFVMAMSGARLEQHEAVTAEEVAALDDASLPSYTVLVPVYREANIVSLLMENLGALDYPVEKLEILLLLEEDDAETIETARASRPPETVQFVVIPDGPPKTKPKACNVGLFFARGEYVVIYDAEDRPDPDQLKKAVVAFRKGPDNLACVQAALNYFNASENFLTRMFTLEYSFWFDYMLPGLHAARLPIPLGGTSNHFRTDLLRELGGWDPFNVTEDADLGVRASARGYAVGVINSTTFEEANSRVGNWIRQRSRWVKGYMQTTLVHLRHPVRLARAIGVRNAASFAMLVGGTPLTYLVTPFLWLIYAGWFVTRSKGLDVVFPPGSLYLSLFNLLIGNALIVYMAMLAVFKRQRYGLIGAALLSPAYWVLHTVAAYKALGQLVTKPFYWEKTEHGISRHHDATPQQTPTS